MFGLMKDSSSCELQNQSQRYHYCATCKSIGTAYGQKSRMFLNYDAVFLSEILAAFLEMNPQDWDESLQAVNQCLVMPASVDEIPNSLKYTAAANLFFAQLKLKDDIVDQEKGKKWIYKLYKNDLSQAAKDLEGFGLDLSSCYQWIEIQLEREVADSSSFGTFEEYLRFCAEPTARITAAVFANSMTYLQLEENDSFYKLGYAFGSLIYLLDAVEDFNTDVKKQKFNPFLQYYEDQQASQILSSSGWNLIDIYRLEVEAEILKLNIKEEQKEKYAARLFSNIIDRQNQWEAPSIEELPKDFSWKKRWASARLIAQELYCEPRNARQKIQYNFIVLAVAVTPQSIWKASSNIQLLLTAFLASLGVGFLLKVLPIKPKQKKKKRRWWRFRRKRRRPSPCQRQCQSQCNSRECRTAALLIFILLILVVGGILGATIWGIILLTRGVIFWGLFWLLLFPVIVGVWIIVYRILYY